MTLALYLIGGFAVLGGLLWIIAGVAQPPKLTKVSGTWLDEQKYDRRQHRPE